MIGRRFVCVYDEIYKILYEEMLEMIKEVMIVFFFVNM